MPSYAKPFRMYRAVQTLSGNATSVSFTSIPENLQVVEVDWTTRDDWTGFQADSLYIRINNDSGSNYRNQYTQGNNATTTTAAAVAQTRGLIGLTARGGATAGLFGSGKVTFPAWNAPHTNFLGYVYQSGILDTAVGTCWQQTGGGVYTGAGPYNRLDFFPDPGATNLVSGTQFILTGWFTLA